MGARAYVEMRRVVQQIDDGNVRRLRVKNRPDRADVEIGATEIGEQNTRRGRVPLTCERASGRRRSA